MTATTVPPQQAKMMVKVRKLLDKAEAFGTTAEEAEALTAKAAELMARYGIEKHMLAAADTTAPRPVPGFTIITVDPPFHHQKKDMLSRIGDAVNLKPVHHHDPGRPGYRETLRVELFGSAADIDRCQVLFRSLLAQATRLIRDEMPPGAKSAYKQSWLNGFSARVAARVREAERQAAYAYDTEHALTGATSTAVVLASWDEQVAAFRAAKYPRLVPGRRRSSSGNGFSAGWAAGDRATIGAQHAIAG